MKKLILENQNDFQILDGTYTTTKDKVIPCYYLKGNTFDLNEFLRNTNPKGIADIFGCMYDRKTKMFVFWKDRVDPRKTITDKIQPLIDRINSFYNYSLEINKLIEELGTYSAPEPGAKDESEDVIATPEQQQQIVTQLQSYKDMLMLVPTEEEFKQKLGDLMDFRRGQGTEYSMLNTIMIKVQRPDSTNVNNAANWKKAFHRTIKPDAVPIFVRRPMKNNGRHSSDAKATADYLKSIGKQSKSELKGGEVTGLQSAIFKGRPKNATRFEFVGHYDVADTQLEEGAEDYIKKGLDAATKVGFDDSVSNIVSDEIKPIYKGLMELADDLNIGINKAVGNNPNISVPQNAGNDANITKDLAKNIFSEILHKDFFKNQGGLVGKLHVGGTEEDIKNQQAELSSWLFLRAYGIDFKTSPLNLAQIWGNDPSKLDAVYTNVQKAVNHVIDFVNVSIKNNKVQNNLNEIDGGAILAKHITKQDVAAMLGIKESSYTKGIKELHESLRRKVIGK